MWTGLLTAICFLYMSIDR